jgi:hypothetical protein
MRDIIQRELKILSINRKGSRGGGMLEDITELRTFVRIVAAGSLSAAGREMGLALSVVSKRLAMLERRTEMRLIARSTRHLALTEEGRALTTEPSASWLRSTKPRPC